MVVPAWALPLALGVILGAIPTKWYYQREQAQQIANVATGMQAMSEAYRARERTLQASVETIRQEAADNEDTIRTDSFAAGGAAERLRQAGSDTANRARCPASTTIGSQAANPAADLLADVLARLDDATGTIAKAADERGAAGDTCWRTLELYRKGVLK